MTNPIVSICCVTYNHAPFIRKALDGFLMQESPTGVTKEEPWCEILIHDDASTDGTTEIIKEYAAKYPSRIFPLYEEENQYSKGAKVDLFNYKRARGSYIAYCEGDDYWTDAHKLQKQVDFMETHPDYSVCWHRVVVVDPNDKKIRVGKADRLFENKQDANGVDIDIPKFFENWYTQPCSMIIRQSCLDLRWSEWYKNYSDTHEIYHLLKKGKGYILNFVGANYRMHKDGISSSQSVVESCITELSFIDGLYKRNRDAYTREYWHSIMLWALDTFYRNGEKELFNTTLKREFKQFPFNTVFVLWKFMKRRIKAYVR